MFSLSRISMLIAAFFLGFSASAGLLIGAAYYAVNSISINKIEELTSGQVDIPTEQFIGENPEVDICDLALTDLAKEMAELAAMSDQLTINILINRYDLILAEEVDKILSEDARNIPIASLVTAEGREKLLGNLYVGHMQGFECKNPDGSSGKPSDEDTYWYNPKTDEIITGLNDVLSNISIGDFIAGRISADSVLCDIYIGDIVGYKYDEDLGYWLDAEGNRATGVMAVFADCTVLTVDQKLNTVQIGDLLGYIYNSDMGAWYEGDNAVHGFMNVVASRTLQDVGGIMDDLTIGDIIPERDGIMAIIPAETKFDEIGSVINDSIMTSPLQFFMNQGLVDFGDKAATLDTLASTLYNYSSANANMITTFTLVNEGQAGYEEFKQNYDYYHNVWTDNGNGTYSIATWRTQPMSDSFGFIVGMFTAQSNMLPSLPI